MTRSAHSPNEDPAVVPRASFGLRPSASRARACAGGALIDQKIVLQRQLSDLGMERLHVDSRLRGSAAATGTEHIGCPFLELRLPRCVLIKPALIGSHLGWGAIAAPGCSMRSLQMAN
jgi:hypothetical protein